MSLKIGDYVTIKELEPRQYVGGIYVNSDMSILSKTQKKRRRVLDVVI